MDYKLIMEHGGLGEVARAIEASKVVGLDLETTALSPLDGEIRLMTLNAGGKLFAIDLFPLKGEIGPVLEALSNRKIIKVLHNAKFDQKWLWHFYGLELWPVFDTYRASRLLYNGLPGVAHDLWALFNRELKIAPQGDDFQKSDWSGSLSEGQYQYAVEDVIHLPKLREVLKAKLREKHLLKTALIEFGVLLPEGVVELTGFRLDPARWMKVYELAAQKRDDAHRALCKLVPSTGGQGVFPGMEGAGINFDSSAQVLKILQEHGVKVEATNAIALSEVKGTSPIVDALLEYRTWSKRCQAFGPDYLSNIRKDTGRVHPEYFGFTHAARYSCSSPNIQQVPREFGYRDCFAAPEGRVLVGADYSGIELRIAAEIAGDEQMIQAFREGKDIHRLTASLTSGTPYDDVTKAQRQNAKAINFGLCLTGDQMVLTEQDGLVRLDEIQPWHRVWDGVEWVSHDGLVYMGEKEVVEYDGITATPDHEVYTESGRKVRIGELAASENPEPLAVGAVGADPVRFDPSKAGGRTLAGNNFSARVEKVYDLMNAGPRHRFTVNGKIVSNCYGMGAKKLVIYARANYGVHLTEAEAERQHAAFFRAYPGLKRWHRRQIREMERTKKVRTLSGRLRYLDPDKHYNEALNTPVQGTGADALKLSLRAVFDRFRREVPSAKIVHHVHDEIIVECNDDPEEIETVKGIVSGCMKESMGKLLKHVPVEVDPASGKSWADLK